MKKTLSIFLFIMILSGCVTLTFVKTYKGELPREEIAILQIPRFVWNDKTLLVSKIDGENIDKNNPVVKLLPGEHTFVINISGYNNKYFVESGPIDFKFKAEAGSTYTLEYRETFDGKYNIYVVDTVGHVIVSKESQGKDVTDDPARNVHVGKL